MSIDKDDRDIDAALEGLDEDKRSTLKRLIVTGAYVGPIVVSFTMADLSIDAFLHVAAANATTPHPTTTAAPSTTNPPAPTTTAGPGATTTAAPGPTTTAAPGPTTTTPRPVTTTTAAPRRPHPLAS